MKHTLIRTVAEAPQEFSGCSHGPAPARRRPANAPPIFVNGVEIPEADIAREAQNHSAASGAEARGAAAHALIIRTLLLQRADALELAAPPLTDGAGREETREEALVRAVLDAEVLVQEPSEAECRRLYERTLTRFTAPELYEASHILIEEDAAGDGEGRARQVIAELKAGAQFTELAKRDSACPSAAQGGSLGQMTRGDLVREVEDAVLALVPGDVATAPVHTRHGWHVVRLDRRIAGQTLPFEAAHAAVRECLRDRAWTAAATRYVESLARAASIEGAVLSLGGGNV